MGKIYGYCRTSTIHQSLTSQITALERFGCEEIVKEQKSGRTAKDRPEFLSLIEKMQEGDTLVVSKLDRFARSTKDALNTIDDLDERGIQLVVLDMGGMKIDTQDRMGRLMLTILSGIAEFELELMKERQREGIEERKKIPGGYPGRPVKYGKNNDKLKHAIDLMQNRSTNGMTIKQISNITGIGRTTLYERMKEIEESKKLTE